MTFHPVIKISRKPASLRMTGYYVVGSKGDGQCNSQIPNRNSNFFFWPQVFVQACPAVVILTAFKAHTLYHDSTGN